MGRSLPVLRVCNVSKKYSELFSLSDINLDLYPGEVHMIVGENGSGKSNIMKIIAGIEKPDSGEIYLNGELSSINTAFTAKNKGILYIHQHTNLYANLSVAENIYYDRLDKYSSVGLDFNVLNHDCKIMLDDLNITSVRWDDIVSHLNFAQKQLVEIAKAYVSDAKIIMFDEPSSALTEIERKILFDVIFHLKKKNIGIIYVSHKLDEIKSIGDRVSIIYHGKIVCTTGVKDIDKSEIVRYMTGSDQHYSFPKINLKPGAEILDVQDMCYENVLKGLSFKLREREILGIAGLMGSGRTCLAQCLFGVKKFTQGSIRIRGVEKKIRSVKDSIKAGIVYVPESGTENLFDIFDVSFNMSLPSLERFSRPKSVVNKGILVETVRKYISKFYIHNAEAKSLLKSLSGGNQQKVNVAKWVMKKASIYILDEPTRGIDIASKIDIYNCMNDLAMKGASIIFISSDIDELIGMCDRILVLSDGVLACELNAKQATKRIILDYALQ